MPRKRFSVFGIIKLLLWTLIGEATSPGIKPDIFSGHNVLVGNIFRPRSLFASDYEDRTRLVQHFIVRRFVGYATNYSRKKQGLLWRTIVEAYAPRPLISVIRKNREPIGCFVIGDGLAANFPNDIRNFTNSTGRLNQSVRIQSRGVSDISIDCCDRQSRPARSIRLKITFSDHFRFYPSSLTYRDSILSNLESFAREPKRVQNGQRAEGSDDSLPFCKTGLISRLLGTDGSRFGRLLLRYEVIVVVLIGFLFAFLGVLGITWILDNPNRNRKITGALLALGCLAYTLTFYGWGSLGHPLAIWVLCHSSVVGPEHDAAS